MIVDVCPCCGRVWLAPFEEAACPDCDLDGPDLDTDADTDPDADTWDGDLDP